MARQTMFFNMMKLHIYTSLPRDHASASTKAARRISRRAAFVSVF